MNAGLQTWDANGTNELRQQYRYEQRQVKVFLEQKRERECKRGQDLVRKTKVPPSRYEGWQQSLHRRKAFSAKSPPLRTPNKSFCPEVICTVGSEREMVEGGKQAYVQSRSVRLATLIIILAISSKQSLLS